MPPLTGVCFLLAPKKLHLQEHICPLDELVRCCRESSDPVLRALLLYCPAAHRFVEYVEQEEVSSQGCLFEVPLDAALHPLTDTPFVS